LEGGTAVIGNFGRRQREETHYWRRKITGWIGILYFGFIRVDTILTKQSL
jgi:hypothetical protein